MRAKSVATMAARPPKKRWFRLPCSLPPSSYRITFRKSSVVRLPGGIDPPSRNRSHRRLRFCFRPHSFPGKVSGSQGFLLAQAAGGPPSDSQTPWTSRLLASPILLARNKQFARLALPKERIVDVLSTLDASGGKLMLAALAQKLGLPLVRVRGILGALRTLLNVDVYSVLTIDESDLSVSLDRG